MTATQVSDEVWRKQDPSAARLRPWTLLRLFFLLLFIAAITAAAPIAVHTGVFQPQIHSTYGGWLGLVIEPDGTLANAVGPVPANPHVRGLLRIVNDGWTPARLVGISVTGPGFTFEHAAVTTVDGRHEGRIIGPNAHIALGPHDYIDMTLDFYIDDCHAVRAGTQYATVRVQDWRGTRAVSVPLPSIDHVGDGWAVTTIDDPHAVSSVRYLADAICGVDMQTR
jgi:hypothetical protein